MGRLVSVGVYGSLDQKNRFEIVFEFGARNILIWLKSPSIFGLVQLL